ncbi:MAG: Rpn family recombination-promoting nuclease/putative transposase [Hormoscilla sp.]
MKQETIKHDRLFKELLKTFFVEFLELFFPSLLAEIDTSYLEFLEQEIFTELKSGEKYNADLVVKTKFKSGGETFLLIHVENQARYETNFEKRMFRYFAFLSHNHGLPVYPIAVLSFDSPRKEQPNSYEVVIANKVVLQFDYDVIQLNRLNWRDFLRHKNPVATALMTKMKIDKEDRWRVKLECLRLLATLKLDPAKTRLISGFIDTYLQLNVEEETQFQEEIGTLASSEQEEIMEIVTSWMVEGELKIVLRLLTRRIGEIAAELQSQIRQLSLIQLEDLAEALLDFEAQTDLVAWLQRVEAEE